MPIISYKVRRDTAKNTSTVDVEFAPYKNYIGNYINDTTGWGDELVLMEDVNHPVTLQEKKSLAVRLKVGKGFSYEAPKDDKASLKRTITTTSNKPHLFTLNIRNEQVTSSRVRVNGEILDYSDTHYVRRTGGVVHPVDNKLEVEIEFNDIKRETVAWIGGFFLTELHEDFEGYGKEELEKIYPFVVDKKDGPTGEDLLRGYDGDTKNKSPFLNYLVLDGRKIPSYDTELTSYGVNEDSVLQVKEEEHAIAITQAMMHDATLMSMLEGDRMHLSAAFPKESGEMSTLSNSHFPRIQYFTGFAVNEVFADSRPFAEEVNYALNVYIPVQKVMESVDALMLTNQSASIMADLGWSKVRGSDYFLKQEQLYIVQTQYIKQVNVKPVRK